MYSKLVRQCPINTVPYTIVQGDTLYKIAQEYNTSIQLLVRLNRLTDPNNLTVGDTICVPKKPLVPPCPNGSYYTIAQGDTLYKIAKDNNISVRKIMIANPFINPYTLMIGQVICIPKKKISCPNGQIYLVKENDTYFLIATKFNVSFNALKKANPTLNLDNLQNGQELCIPPSKPSLICLQDKTYIIKEGENLSSVAEKFVVGADDLLKVNPNMIPSEFVTGRLICIPTQQVPV